MTLCLYDFEQACHGDAVFGRLVARAELGPPLVAKLGGCGVLGVCWTSASMRALDVICMGQGFGHQAKPVRNVRNVADSFLQTQAIPAWSSSQHTHQACIYGPPCTTLCGKAALGAYLSLSMLVATRIIVAGFKLTILTTRTCSLRSETTLSITVDGRILGS